MSIISISLNPEMVRELSRLQKELSFTGKSEIMRAGLRLLIDDDKQKSRLKGIVDGILLIVHDDRYSEGISSIRHEYQGIIKTHVHQHLESGKCLEIIVLKGQAEDVKKMNDKLQRSRHINLVKLVLP